MKSWLKIASLMVASTFVFCLVSGVLAGYRYRGSAMDNPWQQQAYYPRGRATKIFSDLALVGAFATGAIAVFRSDARMATASAGLFASSLLVPLVVAFVPYQIQRILHERRGKALTRQMIAAREAEQAAREAALKAETPKPAPVPAPKPAPVPAPVPATVVEYAPTRRTKDYTLQYEWDGVEYTPHIRSGTFVRPPMPGDPAGAYILQYEWNGAKVTGAVIDIPSAGPANPATVIVQAGGVNSRVLVALTPDGKIERVVSRLAVAPKPSTPTPIVAPAPIIMPTPIVAPISRANEKPAVLMSKKEMFRSGYLMM